MKKTLFIIALTFFMANSAYADEPYCREFTQTIKIGGKQQKGFGTSCLQPDGTWQIVNPYDANENQAEDNYNISDDSVNYEVRDSRYYIVPARPVFSYGLYSGRYYNRYPHRYHSRFDRHYNRFHDRHYNYRRLHDRRFR